MHKKLVLISVFILGVFNLFSQYEKAESAPPNINWYEKESKNFTVYFPQELDSIANYTINYLENNIDKIKFNPKDKIRKSKVILHNQNSISNAFVTSSPRRTEFYINAKPESPHFLHNNNWIDLLSAHEYRHLVQREVGFNSFFNKVVFYLFGEGLSSMLTRSSAPNWYWEGDAVNLETRIGNFGRGRIPHFTLTTQTNLLDKNKIKYDRQALGSLKMKTPNEYETGYLMVKYLKDTFGDSVYNKIIKKAHSQSFLPLPFYRSLKKETKLNYKDLYTLSTKFLPKKTTYLKKSPINKRVKKGFKSYIYPTQTIQNKLIVIRQGHAACEFIDFLNFNASYMEEIYKNQPESSDGMWNRLDYRPLEGFIFAISPFNFTSIAGNLCASPALMGNTVIWKPAYPQIYSAKIIMDVFKEAGLPDGVINLIFVDGPEAGDVIFKDKNFAGLHFNGSTGVFKHLWKEIGNNINSYTSYPRIVGETRRLPFYYKNFES